MEIWWNPLTLPYKNVDGQDILLDIYFPSSLTTGSEPLASLVYFHGGGLTVGNRSSWFPNWMHRRALDAGYAFIVPDYRLIPPSTGYDILEDIKDLFEFLSSRLSNILSSLGAPRVDPESFVVAGCSAGSLCAYLAAIHAQPKPRGVLSLYGMGGDFLTPHYLYKKDMPFFLNRELLDPFSFSEFMYPLSNSLHSTAGSALVYHPASSPMPGYPANPRMQLARLFLQLGVFLDYYTGQHSPSLSANLKVPLISGHVERTAIPEDHITLFPQFNITPSFPQTFLIHGESDSAVLAQESFNLRRLLQENSVYVVMKVVAGQEHSFDYEPSAEGEHSHLFNEAFDFIASCLQH